MTEQHLALVPLRGGKRLGGRRNSPKGLIPLWDSRPRQSIEGRDDEVTSDVVFGRQKLLQCLYGSCGCHPATAINSTKGSCSECTAINQWAVHALSLRMVRFVSNSLHVRGEHAIVTVSHPSGETTVVKGSPNQVGEWKGNIKVKEGTRIAFMPLLHSEFFQALNFEVVSVDPFTNSIIENPTTTSEVLCKEAPVVPTNNMNMKQPSRRKTSPKRNGNVEIKTDTRSHETISVPAPSSELPNLQSTSSDVPVAARGVQQTRGNNLKSTKSSWSEVQSLRSMGKKSLDQTLKAIRPGRATAGKNRAERMQTPKDDDRNPSFLLFFCPLGQDLPYRRRVILSKKAKKMGASVVSDFRAATHIIVSEQISCLEPVAEALGISEPSLKEHLDHNKVPLIDPKWLVNANGDKLDAPTVRDWWYGNLPLNPKKRAGLDSTLSAKKSRHPSRSASEKPIMVRNSALSEQFRILSKLHQKAPLLEADPWKAYTFNIISGRLRYLDFEVDNEPDTFEKLKKIKGFGESTLEKVKQFLEFGEITRIKEFERDPERIAMKNMMGIWGVGRREASRLVQHHGFRTIDQVRKAIRRGALQLDRNQLVGVECYEDINDEMTRDEVEKIGEIVKEATIALYPGAQVEVMGSYRRGKPRCGDVDVHITLKEYEKRVPELALGQILDKLWNKGNTVAFHLTYLPGMESGKDPDDFVSASRYVPAAAWEAAHHPVSMSEKSRHRHSSSTYFGVFHSPVVNGRRRRVDIKMYPYRERAFASLYFTGNGYFNRSMRLRARQLSFSLNDHGLYKAGSKVRAMEASSERDVFEKLGLEYKSPLERDCFDAVVPLCASSQTDFQIDEQDYQEESQHVWID